VRRGNGARTDSAGRGLTGRQAGSSLAAIPVSLPARNAVMTVFDVGPSPNAHSKSKFPAIIAARSVAVYGAAVSALAAHCRRASRCSFKRGQPGFVYDHPKVIAFYCDLLEEVIMLRGGGCGRRSAV
jgi:hypothetical protein